MKTVERIRLVLINIMQNKFKVLLTSLGIIVGTATIVLVVAIGEGAKKEAEAQYSFLSADTIYVNPDYGKFGSDFNAEKTEKLNEELLNNLIQENSYIKSACLSADSYQEIMSGKNKEYVSVSGVTNDFMNTFSLQISEGSELSEQDFESEEKFAIMGGALAEKFFGDTASAIGRRLKIGEEMFRIVGVLYRNADGLQGINHDNAVYIPYSTMKKSKMITDYTLPRIVVKTDEIKNVKICMQVMNGTLNYFMQTPGSYIIEDAGSRIDAATKSARTMSALLTSVALIVLTVGGIGIMNVLFVTVKERTREIGVLKALGGKNSEILAQFLTESVFIGAFGGAVGLIVSVAGLYFMPYFGLSVVPSVQAFLLAFLFAVLTGAVFGFYPAYRASQLKPVDALAYE